MLFWLKTNSWKCILIKNFGTITFLRKEIRVLKMSIVNQISMSNLGTFMSHKDDTAKES